MPYIDAFRTWMYGTATCITEGPRASGYGDVRCRKAHSLWVKRCIILTRTWAHAAVYGAVSCRMSTQHVASVDVQQHSVCERARLQRRLVLNLLKAGHRALESVGFMMQRAPYRPLPTGHHSNDLLPLPATMLLDDDTLLRNVAWPPPPDMPNNYWRRLCWTSR